LKNFRGSSWIEESEQEVRSVLAIAWLKTAREEIVIARFSGNRLFACRFEYIPLFARLQPTLIAHKI
jgi:hypothetical protein